MNQNNPPFFQSLRFRYGLGLMVFLAVGGYFLWQEHEAHIRDYVPLILVLGLCGGMHLFMHGGHGKKPGPTNQSDVDREDIEK